MRLLAAGVQKNSDSDERGHEYIDFDPSNPTLAIQHANEMINSLIAELRGLSLNTTVETPVPSPATPAISDQPPQDSLEEKTTTGNSIKDSLWDAVTNKDWKRFDELLAKLQEADPDGALFWRSLSLYLQVEDGSTTALDDLKKLFESNPSHVGVAIHTARAFRRFSQYEEALGYLRRSVDLCASVDQKRTLIIAMVQTLEDAKRFSDAKDTMLALFSESPEHQTIEALELFSKILREYGDTYSATAVGEFALKRDPAKAALRYRVGLDYHSLKQWNLFLWQYKLYCQNGGDPGGFHNLALAYSNCELPIRSVRSYLQAYGLGEALSASNLAHKYLDAGMAREARALVNDALAKYPDSAAVVGRALAEIAEREKDEEDKEERLLDEAAKTREFLIAYGEGFVAAPLQAIDGMWVFPFGNINLRLERDSIVGSADIEEKESPLLSALLGRRGQVTGSSKTVTRYSFTGRATGRTCQFTLHEKPVRPVRDPPAETLLGGLSDTKKSNGHIVFRDDMQSAQLMQVDADKWAEPYTIRRVTPAREPKGDT